MVRSQRCKGVVIQTFGAGNIPNGEPYSFEPMIELSSRLGKPVIITTQASGYPSAAGSLYGPGFGAIRAGAIPTGNMTHAAATVKLRWILARIEKELDGKDLDPMKRVRLTREGMGVRCVSEMD
uniref:Asparaginase n=1 Tax=Candidatus Kentrum sp. LFY TaxID=2126342 RepID=A0A450UAE8_9GAMM|nr:MAG: Asparaginase [Candidatus Kentron sp. LFY]